MEITVSIPAVKWALQGVRGLSHMQRLVLVGFAEYTNSQGATIVSSARVAKDLEMHRSHVCKYRKQLIDLGAIKVTPEVTSLQMPNVTPEVSQVTPEVTPIRTTINHQEPPIKKKGKKKTPVGPLKRATQINPTNELQTSALDWWTGKAGQLGIAFPNIWETFVAHHQAKGSTMKDWNAAWRTWALKEIKWTTERSVALERRANASQTTLVAVRSAMALRKALREGKQVSMEPGGYDVPQQLVTMKAAGDWMNVLAAREQWSGRVVQVVERGGYVVKI